jgi:hypothetical protein
VIPGQKKAMTPAKMSATPSRNNGQERSCRLAARKPAIRAKMPSTSM